MQRLLKPVLDRAGALPTAQRTVLHAAVGAGEGAVGREGAELIREAARATSDTVASVG